MTAGTWYHWVITYAGNNASPKTLKAYRDGTEIIDSTTPNIKACCLLIFPVGIGLRQVLGISLSKSASYHILSAPAAPAPMVTKKILINESNKGIVVWEVNNPTAQVNITKDITLGFINNSKDFK